MSWSGITAELGSLACRRLLVICFAFARLAHSGLECGGRATEHFLSEAEKRDLGLSELEPQPHGLAWGSKFWTGQEEGLGARFSSAPGHP